MIEVLFKRKSRTLSWPVPSGTRTVEAFSEVRNELNGKRPDPARLPDVETGLKRDRSKGPVVMPRPFPVGTWKILGVEDVVPGTPGARWMQPVKVITDAHQLVDIWSTRNDTGQYHENTGEKFDDWCYWIHFANGSHHTDGCVGQTILQAQLDFAQMVRNALAQKIPITLKCTDE